jgi:hypothetical protein
VQSDQEEDGWWQYGQKFFLQLFDSFVHRSYSYVLPAVLYSLPQDGRFSADTRGMLAAQVDPLPRFNPRGCGPYATSPIRVQPPELRLLLREHEVQLRELGRTGGRRRIPRADLSYQP